MIQFQRHKMTSLAYACLMGFVSTSVHAGSIEEAKAFIVESFNNCKIDSEIEDGIDTRRLESDRINVVTFPASSTIKVVEQYEEIVRLKKDDIYVLTEKKYISQANLADLNPDSVVFKNGALTIECSKAKCFNVAEYRLRYEVSNRGEENFRPYPVDPNKNYSKDSQLFSQHYTPCNSKLGARAAKAFSDLIRLSGGKASAY